jgi:hypothetical protein
MSVSGPVVGSQIYLTVFNGRLGGDFVRKRFTRVIGEDNAVQWS